MLRRRPRSPPSGAWEAAGSEKPFSASCWTEISSFAKASQDTTQGAKPGCNIRCARVFMEECYEALKPRLLLDGISLSSLWPEEVVAEEEEAAAPLVAAAASAEESNGSRTTPAAAAAESEEGEGQSEGDNGAEDDSKDRRTLTAAADAGTEEHQRGEAKGGEPAAQREGSTDGKEGNKRGTEGKEADIEGKEGTAKDTEGKEGKNGDTGGKESNGMYNEGEAESEADREEGQAGRGEEEEDTNNEELLHVLHAPPRVATPEQPPPPRYTAPKQVVDEDHELPDRVYDWILETELSARKAMTCKKMERAFDIIDADKSGDIDLDELRVAFDTTKGKAGSAIQLQQIFHSDDVLRNLASYER